MINNQKKSNINKSINNIDNLLDQVIFRTVCNTENRMNGLINCLIIIFNSTVKEDIL